MTTQVTIVVPANADWQVLVTQEDLVQSNVSDAMSFWKRNVSADYKIKPGDTYVTHIWDTKRIIIEEEKLI